ncbi:MAG: hypothetical protein JWM88_1679 [Verrucomicrobia bacterium]|nr:hypothetical protein [Verrucomicrobiota bacterium]
MNKVIALILLIAGIALVYTGNQRRHSIAGASEAAGKELASKVDGDARFPAHTLYMAGGVVLIIVGGAMLFRSPRVRV